MFTAETPLPAGRQGKTLRDILMIQFTSLRPWRLRGEIPNFGQEWGGEVLDGFAESNL
jgi:hypothetical protein